MRQFNPITIKSDKVVSSVTSICKVSKAIPLQKYKEEASKAQFKEYTAVWDTGATRTTISQKIVDELGLSPVGKVWSSTANGMVLVDTYPICVLLPNDIAFPTIIVPCNNLGDTEMLIGMDIIGHGDFSLTSVGNKTTFSFRMPSVKEIDYEEEKRLLQKYEKIHAVWLKQGNRRCPCGSGKYWELCHGKD